MNEWIFLVSGLGFLLAYPMIGKLNIFSASPNLRPFVWQCFHLIWQVPVLIFLYQMTIGQWLPEKYAKEWLTFFFFLIAYLLGQTEKENDYFFLAPFMLALIAYYDANSNLVSRCFMGIYLGLGVMLFEIFILGIAEKTRLSLTDSRLEGLPLHLVTASIVTMALCGLFSIVS